MSRSRNMEDEIIKQAMLDFLDKAQLPIYFEEREVIRGFIETFFDFLANQPILRERKWVTREELMEDFPMKNEEEDPTIDFYKMRNDLMKKWEDDVIKEVLDVSKTEVSEEANKGKSGG
jgi:hypothetical protein